jgi:hypothetical protein
MGICFWSVSSGQLSSAPLAIYSQLQLASSVFCHGAIHFEAIRISVWHLCDKGICWKVSAKISGERVPRFVSNSATAKSQAQMRNEDEEDNTSLKRVLSAGTYTEVPTSCWILAWIFLQHWTRSQPKFRMTFSGLHSTTVEKANLFIMTAQNLKYHTSIQNHKHRWSVCQYPKGSLP